MSVKCPFLAGCRSIGTVHDSFARCNWKYSWHYLFCVFVGWSCQFLCLYPSHHATRNFTRHRQHAPSAKEIRKLRQARALGRDRDLGVDDCVDGVMPGVKKKKEGGKKGAGAGRARGAKLPNSRGRCGRWTARPAAAAVATAEATISTPTHGNSQEEKRRWQWQRQQQRRGPRLLRWWCFGACQLCCTGRGYVRGLSVDACGMCASV